MPPGSYSQSLSEEVQRLRQELDKKKKAKTTSQQTSDDDKNNKDDSNHSSEKRRKHDKKKRPARAVRIVARRDRDPSGSFLVVGQRRLPLGAQVSVVHDRVEH